MLLRAIELLFINHLPSIPKRGVVLVMSRFGTGLVEAAMVAMRSRSLLFSMAMMVFCLHHHANAFLVPATGVAQRASVLKATPKNDRGETNATIASIPLVS